MIIFIILKEKFWKKKLFFKKNIKNKIIEKSKILDAKAWVRKYFNEASEENKLLDFIIKGIKDNKLISKPIQTLSQDEEQILIKLPRNKVLKNNIL